MKTREETMDECNKVFEYLADPKSYMTPIIVKNKEGKESVAFESWECYDTNIWTLSDAFMFLIDGEDVIVPSKYAEYRAADLLESYTRDIYYKASKLKDKSVAAWLGEYKID